MCDKEVIHQHVKYSHSDNICFYQSFERRIKPWHFTFLQTMDTFICTQCIMSYYMFTVHVYELMVAVFELCKMAANPETTEQDGISTFVCMKAPGPHH